MPPAAELAPAYLVVGDDQARVAEAVSRLRHRAEREGAVLEAFADELTSAEDLLGALPAMSLIGARRYLLAEGAERWTVGRAKPVIAALATLPDDVTVVLIAREQGKVKAPKGLAEAVEAASGRVLRFEAPKARDLPSHLVAEAGRRGIRLDAQAARILIDRMGESTIRLGHELDRLALWAGEGGTIGADDLEAMIADTSEEVVWKLSDAIVSRDRAGAAAAAVRLTEQGESVTPLVYQAAKRLREARMAMDGLEAGRSERELEASLPMHPYAAKQLIRRARDADPRQLRWATCSIADLEWWTRGGSDYPDDVALVLAVARATGSPGR